MKDEPEPSSDSSFILPPSSFPRRVAFLGPAAGLGWAERVLLHLLASRRQADPGLDLRLVVPGDGPLADRAAALGARPLVVPMPAALAGLGESHLRGGRWRAWPALARQA